MYNYNWEEIISLLFSYFTIFQCKQDWPIVNVSQSCMNHIYIFIICILLHHYYSKREEKMLQDNIIIVTYKNKKKSPNRASKKERKIFPQTLITIIFILARNSNCILFLTICKHSGNFLSLSNNGKFDMLFLLNNEWKLCEASILQLIWIFNIVQLI